LWLGVIATFALPMVGYFDEHNYSTIHGISAGAFFISVSFYAWILSGIMEANKEKFPQD